jgi:hypothetical protein
METNMFSIGPDRPSQPIYPNNVAFSGKNKQQTIGYITFEADKTLDANATAIIRDLREKGDKVIRIYPEKTRIVYTDKGIKIYHDGEPLKLDAAFFYGAFSKESGVANQRYTLYALLNALQATQVPLLDSPAALQITDDKRAEAQVFSENGIPILSQNVQ